MEKKPKKECENLDDDDGKKSASRNCPLCNVAIDRCYVDDAKSGKTFFSLSSCLLPKCSADNLSWVALTTSDFSSLRLYVSLVFSLSHLKNKTRERGDSSCNVDGGGGRKKINRDRFLSQMSSISIIALRFHLRLNEKNESALLFEFRARAKAG